MKPVDPNSYKLKVKWENKNDYIVDSAQINVHKESLHNRYLYNDPRQTREYIKKESKLKSKLQNSQMKV